MKKKKSMQVQAQECADRLCPGNWWCKPDLVEAFKAGWRASTKQRSPQAKVTRARSGEGQ